MGKHFKIPVIGGSTAGIYDCCTISLSIGIIEPGNKAPEFTAVTTQGEINYPLDYKGE